jgi:AraC-like DNA-binding protein
MHIRTIRAVCDLRIKVKLSFKKKESMAILFTVLSVIILFLLFRILLSSRYRKKNAPPLILLDKESTVDKEAVKDKGNNQVFLEYADDAMAIPNEGCKYLSEEDRKWLARLDEILLREIGNNKFDIEAVAIELHMSRRTFYRKMLKVSDLSPKKYHNRFRFEYVKMLLETRKLHSVKAAAAAIGMRDVEYFSKMYRKQYGRYPSVCFHEY